MNRRVRRTVAPGRMLYARLLMNKVSRNIEGVRTKTKRSLLLKLLKDFRAGVCVLSETHLRKQNWVECGFLGIALRGTTVQISPLVSGSAEGGLKLVRTSFSSEHISGAAGQPTTDKYCPVIP